MFVKDWRQEMIGNEMINQFSPTVGSMGEDSQYQSSVNTCPTVKLGPPF